jgi:WXG100 family type VII secretion target
MSASGRFQTEMPTMDTAARHVYEVNDQIQSQLSSLLQRLEPLMGTWQGAAAASFHVLKQRWHDNATRLNGALRGIGDGLVQAEQNYAGSEDVSQQDFTGLTGNLS